MDGTHSAVPFVMRFWIVLVVLAGCGDSTPSTDAGTDTGVDSSFDSSIDSEPCGECDTVDFSVEVDGEPLTEGRVVDWVWGFQGGTMITPTIVFQNGVTLGETVEVEVRHMPDPDAPDLFGEAEDFRGPYTYFFEVWRNDGRLIAGPIDDQLGWVELDGMRLIHSVQVRAARGTTTRSTAIELATHEPDACEPFELYSGGPGSCPYRLIPGDARVTVGDPDPDTGSCTNARGVSFEFTPDSPDEANACAEIRGANFDLLRFTVGAGMDPPAGCLDSVGLIDGATIRSTVMVIERGGCTPQLFRIEADTTACDEMCF